MFADPDATLGHLEYPEKQDWSVLEYKTNSGPIKACILIHVSLLNEGSTIILEFQFLRNICGQESAKYRLDREDYVLILDHVQVDIGVVVPEGDHYSFILSLDVAQIFRQTRKKWDKYLDWRSIIILYLFLASNFIHFPLSIIIF